MTQERPRASMRVPETEDFPTGPDVGELLPDFTLPDQHGNQVAFHTARGNDRAYLVFIRATSW